MTNGGRITSSKDTQQQPHLCLCRHSADAHDDGQWRAHHLTWSGHNLTQIVTTKSDTTTLMRVRYNYDASNRLSTVTTNLSPDDNAITDGKTVVTTYTYDRTSDRVASISQKLTFDSGGQLTKMELPPAQSGATAQVINSTSHASGNVLIAQDASSNTITYTYDGNGNLLSQRDQITTLPIHTIVQTIC